jgi:hypothetical protein
MAEMLALQEIGGSPVDQMGGRTAAEEHELVGIDLGGRIGGR